MTLLPNALKDSYIAIMQLNLVSCGCFRATCIIICRIGVSTVHVTVQYLLIYHAHGPSGG